MTLGQRIQELRKQNGLSQEALGEKLGVSRQAVSRWEMDGAVPEVDKLIAMGKLFGVSLNDLLRVANPGAEVPEVPEGEAQEPPAQPSEEEPVPSPAPARSNRPPTTLLALLCAALVLTSVLSLAGVAQLRGRLTALEGQVAELTQAAVGLDPTAPLVASVDYDFTFLPDNKQMVDCTFALTAAQMAEDMTVTLQLVDGEGQVQLVEMERSKLGGSAYTASFAIDAYLAPITCTALFETPSGSYTKALIRWTNIRPATNSWSWESLDESLIIS